LDKAQRTKDEFIRKKAAIITLIVGSTMFILQGTAFYYTDSSTIMSNAIESLVHIAAIAFVVFCIYYSSQPPDEEHPFGHGKIENFSIGFEGGLIFIAGLGIIIESIRNYVSGQNIRNLDVGITITICVILINFALSYYLRLVGTKTHSSILIAESKHEMSDAVASLGSLVGLLAILITGYQILDIIVAILVAMHLLYTGGKLINDAFKKLMDEADHDILVKISKALNEIRDADWLDIHNLKVMENGDLLFVEFHMVIPSEWSILKAHTTMDLIEEHLLMTLECRGRVMIHPDPNEKTVMNSLLIDEDELSKPFTVKRVTRFVPDAHTHSK
jgi:cation diffusion facilitator family transporter